MSGYNIEVPKDYFARIAAKEYSDDAGMAVVREFAQNSADAGATRVEFSFTGSGDGARLVVKDDGRGCSVENVKTKLLVPLGTVKDVGAIGGFGKAKELIFFANPRWEIRTRGVSVVGSYLTVQSFESGLPAATGFRAEVQLPPALHQAAWNAAKNFLRCSERPGVTWVLNGEVIDCEVKRPARAAKDFGFCKAYVDKNEPNDSTIYLRTGGLLTSTRLGYHTVGRVILDVTGTSCELLTPARNWFRSSDHGNQVSGWLNQLVTNAKQTLADEEGDEVQWQDMELVAPLTDAEKAAISARDVVPKHEGIPTKMEFNQLPVEGLTQTGGAYEGRFASEAAARRDQQGGLSAKELDEAAFCADPKAYAPGAAEVMTPRKRTDGFDMSLLPVLVGALRLVVHTGGRKQAAVATRWLKKHGEAATAILAAWATAVRVVAQRTGLPVDAVGFTFAIETRAEFFKVKNRFALLINPMLLDLTSSEAADDLLDCALHETSHLAHGDGHSEAFVYGESAMRRKVRGSLVRGAIARALRQSEVQSIEEA